MTSSNEKKNQALLLQKHDGDKCIEPKPTACLILRLEGLTKDDNNDNNRRMKNVISPRPSSSIFDVSFNQNTNGDSVTNEDSCIHKKRKITKETKESQTFVRNKRIRRLSKLPSYNRAPSHSDFPVYHDELDAQLAEELTGCISPIESDIEATPIPLLTPPASPIPMKIEQSDVEIYEWPSNLAVDNALTAASKLHPLSLSEMEEIDECREPFSISVLEIPCL